MHVGETYELHWPHSSQGNCAGDWSGKENARYQTPFYDGVLCGKTDTLAVGVQGQVFLVVNDDSGDYDHDNLLEGMVTYEGQDIANYTGSTTGSSVNNEQCSWYTGITWHVDRACHKISARSFDEMCGQMLVMGMEHDVYPHGARELVDDKWTTDKVMDRRLAEDLHDEDEHALCALTQGCQEAVSTMAKMADPKTEIPVCPTTAAAAAVTKKAEDDVSPAVAPGMSALAMVVGLFVAVFA